ncbi:ATP-binding protein [Streptomyces cinereoruber]|uniref:ATP-binding protein n=1 Tax=Streptomyces cinereoruber TaxID=67260 RepID=UPI003638AF1C
MTDDVVAVAMIDRLVHHSEVLALTGDSYRTRQRCDLLAMGSRTHTTEPAPGGLSEAGVRFRVDNRLMQGNRPLTLP